MRRCYLCILSLLMISLLSSNVIAQTKLENNSKDLILSVAYSNIANNADYALFTDTSCSQLKDGVTLNDIKNIKSPLLRDIAVKLYGNNYDTKYRVEKYKAIPSPNIIAAELKIGNGFSRYENITGMFFKAGRVAVIVGKTDGYKIGLRLPNLMRKPKTDNQNDWSLHDTVVELREGVNFIDLPYDANAYVDYYVEGDVSKAPEITVHFPMGEVNGYFDATTQTDAEWNELLDNAVSPIMDMKGRFIQVAYPVEFFKQFTYNRGVELIDNYDKMLLSQYKFIGLEKYNKLPKN